jgi:hypothetical protein
MTEEEHAKLLAGGAVVVGHVPAGCKVIKVGRELWIEHPDGKREPLPKEKPPAP